MDKDDQHREQREELFGQLLASKPRRAGKSAAMATVTSLTLHAMIVTSAVWATLEFGRAALPEPLEQVTFLEMFDERPEPTARPEPPIREPQPSAPPPVAPPPPPQPKVEATVSAEDGGGFQTLAEPAEVPDEVPASSGVAFSESDFSGEGVEGGRGGGALDAEPKPAATPEEKSSLTPYTVAPVLLNQADVSRAVGKLYPRMLKRIGASGTVLLSILIDEGGRVVKSAIKRSSGREAFDQAALEIPALMRFKPALKSDTPVAAWVVIPIEFRDR